VTEAVAGRESRDKYHVAIDLDCGFLLFINSEYYDGAMRIDRSDWPEMPNPESFISCNSGIRYSRKDLKNVAISPCGRLSDDCIRRLHQHISNSYVMPIKDVNVALPAFRVYFAD